MRQTKPLAWGRQVSPGFRERLFQLCENLGWSEDQASDLMAIIAFETGRMFSPSVRNPRSSATGLIQFMAATAKALGTSTKALAAMTPEGQLDYVERYFRPHASRIKTLEDMYMTVLWPRAVGRTLEYVLWKTGTRAFAVNRGLDLNRDGRVTKREAAAKVREQREVGLGKGHRWDPPKKTVPA